MRLLQTGSTGPATQLLQTALNRAGYGPLLTDGVFGAATAAALISFQRAFGLVPDGIAGSLTHRRLLPFYTGYLTHRVVRGDSLWSISRFYGADLNAVRLANPGVDENNLAVGSVLIVPLPFDVVPTDIDWFSGLVAYCVRGLSARYPFLGTGEIGKSVMGRPLWSLRLGSGDTSLLYNASHHANEWITTVLLMYFTEQLCKALVSGGFFHSVSLPELFGRFTLFLVPAVNPDGIDLVTGELQGGTFYDSALRIARRYPRFSFPGGWKANIRGIDLNLQYPAGWEQAKANKAAQGIVSPAPADFVGSSPLAAPESRAMYDFTYSVSPSLIEAWHTQGEVIYWKYQDYASPDALRIGEYFASLSGYTLENTPYSSGFAGYKDWFIQDFDRPGYTIEAGRGANPLPVSDFDALYRRCEPVLFGGLTAL